MVTLLLMRHGESVGNQQQLMQGHGDYPLSERGRQQVLKLAQRLAAEFKDPSQIYSSPLPRAQQTTKIILQYQGSTVPCDYTMAIAEGDAGIFEGLTWRAASEAYPELCHQLETHRNWIPIPGAESPQQIHQRAQNWIEKVLKEHRQSDRIWVVTHEWFLYHLVSALLGCDRTWQFPVDHTALFEFTVDSAHWHQREPNMRYNSIFWQIRRFNDTQHL